MLGLAALGARRRRGRPGLSRRTRGAPGAGEAPDHASTRGTSSAPLKEGRW